jgi:hypothetical protein
MIDIEINVTRPNQDIGFIQIIDVILKILILNQLIPRLNCDTGIAFVVSRFKRSRTFEKSCLKLYLFLGFM